VGYGPINFSFLTKNTKIPDFLIVGAAKSGTSSLHNYLALHPNLCLPERVKELNFWHTFGHEAERAILNYADVYPRTLSDYVWHFKHRKPGQLCGEASPSYLIYYQDTVDNLMKLHTKWQDVHIIIILREPIDKIWSHYRFIRNLKLDPLDLTLPEMLNLEDQRINDMTLLPDLHLIHNTRYYEQVKYYMDHFPKVRVLLYDDLLTDTQQVLNEITGFLGVDTFIPDNINRVFNASSRVLKAGKKMRVPGGHFLSSLLQGKVKHKISNVLVREEKMTKKTKRRLANIFKPEVKSLEKLIDRDLSRWLKRYEK
jgi:hypothetical protein